MQNEREKEKKRKKERKREKMMNVTKRVEGAEMLKITKIPLHLTQVGTNNKIKFSNLIYLIGSRNV